MTLIPYLNTLTKGLDLSFKDACSLSTTLIQFELNPHQVAGILTSLKTKGETFEEISGFAKGLKENAITVSSHRTKFHDIVGTGGDGAHTFNISTTCAFVLSGAGVNIAKHGNRSISSKCGSADVLHQLGVNIHATPKNIEHQLNTIGLSFIYAPLAHPSMKNVMTVRKQLGIPTIFNIVGPLANPMNLEGQLIGVYAPHLIEIMAQSMIQLGIKKGAVVYGAGGLDEASLSGDNDVAFIKNGLIQRSIINPETYGLNKCAISELKGGNPKLNASIVLSVLEGKTGPHRDVVLLNCGIALYAYGKTESIQEGITLAAQSIDEEKALHQLKELIRISNS